MMILLAPHHRRRLRQQRRPLLALLVTLFLLDALLLLRARPRTTRTTQNQHGQEKPSVFIVSVHRNTANILPEWGAAALALVDYLGHDKVYFSALESGSQDGTKAELVNLKAELDARGVPNTIELGKDVYGQLEEMWTRPDPNGPRQEGWIWNQEDNVYDLRRITYLAKERNRAMQPLEELERMGKKFDKILWINDVVFNVRSTVFVTWTFEQICTDNLNRPKTFLLYCILMMANTPQHAAWTINVPRSIMTHLHCGTILDRRQPATFGPGS